MDLVSHGPFVASTVTWQATSGAFALTVIVKATFTLQLGTAQLAAEQDPILERDRHYDDDPRRSVRFPSDVVPYKPLADVLLVGHAYAPNKQPVRSLVTRFCVGTEMDKSIEVFCDRAFRVLDAQLLEAKRFTQMPLVWERASSGPESANPVGKRFDGPTDTYGTIAIANLQPPGQFVARRSDTFVPTCYAPIAPTWPGRTHRGGQSVRSVLDNAWNEKPLPGDLDPAFFLVAPPDQNIAEIRANERIVLDNLHPEHAHLVMNLPGLRPRAIVDRAAGEREEIALVGDTLLVDTDRGVCCVVWRGRIGLRSADEAGRISVLLDGAFAEVDVQEDLQVTMPPRRPDVPPDEDAAAMTMIGAFVSKASAPVMPFAGAGKQSSGGEAIRNIADGVLPFGKSAGAEASAAIPVAALVEPAGPLVQPLVVVPVPPPPAMIKPPPTIEQSVQPLAPMTWSVPDVVAKPSIGQLAVEAMSSSTPLPPKQPEPAQAPQVAIGGGLQRRISREIVDLLWFATSAMPRIRKHDAWKDLLADVKPRPNDEDLDDDMPPGKRPTTKDRREILAILARGPGMRVEELEHALHEGVGDDGGFVPPLVLVHGELEFQFDEVEMLKGLVAAASPLTIGDKKLKETIEQIHEVFKMPWVQGATAVVDALTAQLREAIAQTKVVSLKTIETHAERALMDHRHFQKRLVLGQMRIRAIMTSGGSAKVPVYLPEALAKDLPGFQRFKARVIGELRLRVDQGETATRCVRAVALSTVG